MTIDALSTIATVFASVISIIFIIFRLPNGERNIIIVDTVVFKMVDTSYDLRLIFESVLGGKAVYLSNGARIFVRTHDYNVIWSVSPVVRAQNENTMKVSVSAPPLLFGGVGRAKLLKAEEKDQSPVIIK